MTEELHLKYRPKSLDFVIGQEAVVRSLTEVVGRGRNHTFLFVGPSGCGKTTLARVVATMVGCGPNDIQEIDGATYTGIDDMRAVTSSLAYRPTGKAIVRALVIDEAQALSKQSWQSLLKAIEEPPPWVYWFFCTTEPTKVPENIKTRCLKYEIKAVSPDKLYELLTRVAKKEKLLQGDGGNKIIDLCASEANGSPRQALVNLSLCASASNRAEAAELLRSAADSLEAVELARALLRGAPWREISGVLAMLKETNPESVRHVVRAYMTKVVLGAKDDKSATRALELLEAFSTPCNSSDGISPVVLAAGRAVFA